MTDIPEDAMKAAWTTTNGLLLTFSERETLSLTIARAIMEARDKALEDAAKDCDRIAGNVFDFNRDYRRAAGHCASNIRAMKSTGREESKPDWLFVTDGEERL